MTERIPEDPAAHDHHLVHVLPRLVVVTGALRRLQRLFVFGRNGKQVRRLLLQKVDVGVPKHPGHFPLFFRRRDQAPDVRADDAIRIRAHRRK
jgi:hypothetical protein